MSGLDLQTGLYLLAAAIVGAAIGWLIRAGLSRRKLGQLGAEWRARLEEAVRHKDRLNAENASTQSSLEAERASVQKFKHAAVKSQTELESLREKLNMLSKDLFTVGAERDELNNKLTRFQNLVNAAKQRLTEQQKELAKIQDFYKSQLETSLDQRKALQRKIEDAKSEQESLRNLLMSAKAEHESVSKMLASAQSRLKDHEALEQKVVSLEADNAELRHDAALATREIESLKRYVTEMDALKEQNRELSHCLQSMEASRKQYETDARRYRAQYEESEKESETLRFKLGDIEQNIAELQKSKDKGRKANKIDDSELPTLGLSEPHGEPDDLKQIVGIGKVFEETLHRLGIFHFRQIAAFGPAEIARINAELKEFRGRIEHDDWIGQAKELHFKKYGAGSKA